MDLIRSMITEIKIVLREDGKGVHLEFAGDLARRGPDLRAHCVPKPERPANISADERRARFLCA
jgi:hypothetical protein